MSRHIPNLRIPDMDDVNLPPILAHKDFDAASVFEPENLLREARRQKNLPAIDVPEIAILDPDGDIVRMLVGTGRARRAAGWACYHTDLYEFDHRGQRFGIIGCAVGASFAVLLAEQLFVSGCRLLISVTSAGQIVPRGSPPYFVLIDRALRDEGTSYHYLPPSEFVDADPVLVERVMQVSSTLSQPLWRGASWTTDAPFRETAGTIERCRARNILAVEMEAAALYAFAQVRRKPVLCFAHVTNQMAVSQGDFEKGEADGALASLDVIAAAAGAWRHSPEPAQAGGAAAPTDQTELLQFLEALGIETRTVDYPEHQSVEQGRALRGAMSGTFTKNLLLRDKKSRLFMVVVHEDRVVDLKTLPKQIGAKGTLSFASADQMRALLRVEPGAVTPFALLFDRSSQVTPVIDEVLLAAEQVNFHPLKNTQSTGIRPQDLLAFLTACDHQPTVVNFEDPGEIAQAVGLHHDRSVHTSWRPS